MKKENYKTRFHITILYCFICIGIIVSNRNIALDNKTQLIKNMDTSTEAANLNNTINTLQTSHTEYANYIQRSKSNLATAITNAGVTTNGDDTFETIIANISNIMSSTTNDATATEERILIGQTAYINGNKVTGTMADRGTLNWNPTSSTNYTVPAGYYSGGTISTSNAYNAGYNAGKAASTAKLTLVASGLTSTGSINVSSKLSNYSSLTSSDFLLVITNMLWNNNKVSVDQKPSISYNANTGVLSYAAGAMGWSDGAYAYNVVSIYCCK